MESIQDLQERYAQIKGADLRSFPEVKEEILQDDEVKQIINRYGDVVDDEMIEAGLNELFWVTRFRQEPEYRFYKLEINIQNGNFVHTFVERPEALPLLNKPASRRKLDLSMVSKDNQQATLEEFHQTTERIGLLSEVVDFIKNYEEGKFQTGFWVVGGYGIGKSYLMAAMAKRLNRKLAGVTMIDLNEFISSLKADIRTNGDNLEKKLKAIETVDILIIDDIGAEALTDWVADDILYRVLNYRHKYKKTTFFTSNLTKGQYAKKLMDMSTKTDKANAHARAGRIMTRIDSLVKEVQVTGQNRRELNS